ncbi:hypothetical protein BS47DRAFT_1398551 [Hydnum rufescens UP504]|uniref:Uncharacterized protein n=1 Tax=Hydnum rufescens UP504 TaxID=1448309 RepID=A0A9P6AKG5_9AGAM|nr:hypothetical protein BS47DRAFT_1398551 [Hydnum rufescens UP504]
MAVKAVQVDSFLGSSHSRGHRSRKKLIPILSSPSNFIDDLCLNLAGTSRLCHSPSISAFKPDDINEYEYADIPWSKTKLLLSGPTRPYRVPALFLGPSPYRVPALFPAGFLRTLSSPALLPTHPFEVRAISLNPAVSPAPTHPLIPELFLEVPRCFSGSIMHLSESRAISSGSLRILESQRCFSGSSRNLSSPAPISPEAPALSPRVPPLFSKPAVPFLGPQCLSLDSHDPLSLLFGSSNSVPSSRQLSRLHLAPPRLPRSFSKSLSLPTTFSSPLNSWRSFFRVRFSFTDFGAVYPDKHDPTVYFFARIDGIRYRNMHADGPMFLAEIILGLTVFGGIDPTQCPNPFFSCDFSPPPS